MKVKAASIIKLDGITHDMILWWLCTLPADINTVDMQIVILRCKGKSFLLWGDEFGFRVF